MAIETWMRETEATVNSQDSYKEDALKDDEIEMIYNYFEEALSFELSKRNLLILLKSVKLLLIVTSNLKTVRSKLAPLFDSLLVNILSSGLNDKLKKLFVQEFTILLENCIDDSEANFHVVTGLSQRLIGLGSNSNIMVWIRATLLKSLNKLLVGPPSEIRINIFHKHQKEIDSLVDGLYLCGDYDFQVTIIETLLKVTNKSIRQQVVKEWFPNYVKVQSLFLRIKDFETDCRNFLNLLNEGLGENCHVFSYKAISCQSEGTVMSKPDELNEMWIDINLGSKNVSWYYVLQGAKVRPLIFFSLPLLTLLLLGSSLEAIHCQQEGC